MNLFIINLPTSIDRRQQVIAQLEPLDVVYSFFDAINVRDDRTHYFHHYDKTEFFRRTGRYASAGEIGCYASHLTLWRACVVLNKPIVILEDDFAVRPNFSQALRSATQVIDELGFIRLENSTKRTGFVAARYDQFSFRYCSRYPYGATAYAISPSVAQTFIDASSVFNAPLDRFIKDFWCHGQALYSVVPHCVDVGTHGKRSTIHDRGSPSPNNWQQLARFVRKRRQAFQRSLFNMRMRYRHATENNSDSLSNYADQNSQRTPIAGSNGSQYSSDRSNRNPSLVSSNS